MNFMERNPELRELIAASEIASGQLLNYTEAIRGVYIDYAHGLPNNSAWKTGKLEHVGHAAKDVRTYADLFGLTGKELDVVVFLVTAHDTGRLIHELVQRANGKRLPWPHGVESANFAQHIFGAKRRDPLCLAMYLAIHHHSDIETPLLEAIGDKATHALICLLRDFDKMTGYENALKYVSDEEFKQKQIDTNFSVQRKSDPTWGDEKGKIDPETMLDTFLAGKALVRDDCQSYEAYMLQYLAWVFDIQNREVLEISIKNGGPKHVLTYLLLQLAHGAPEQHERLMAWAETWQDGILLSN
ncbi:MAG: hypothetical protein ABIO72_04420 [Patescibacteria group bacterium]